MKETPHGPRSAQSAGVLIRAGAARRDRALRYGCFYPISATMAHADLAASFRDDAASGSPEIFGSGVAGERTIRVLSDDEEALLARSFIGGDANDRHPQGDAENYVASMQMAAALGSTLLWLASFWDPRLTGVLLWLFILGLLLRPPRLQPHASQTKPED